MNKLSSIFIISIFILLIHPLSLKAEKVSAYFTAPHTSIDKLEKSLTREGFEVLTTYTPAKKEYLKVIVFTSKTLKTLASKKGRGFSAIQRILIDNKHKTIRVTNPHYWMHAFMQDAFDNKIATRVLDALTHSLGTLVATKDILDKKDISKYHFAISMPYYHDMLTIRQGKDLLNQINKKKKLFEVPLSKNQTLVGVKMSKNAENFIDVIGEENAILLPYTILIEDDKAYVLHPKYYLSVSYPMLSLADFMKISSAPDAIIRKLKKIFK